MQYAANSTILNLSKYDHLLAILTCGSISILNFFKKEKECAPEDADDSGSLKQKSIQAPILRHDGKAHLEEKWKIALAGLNHSNIMY